MFSSSSPHEETTFEPNKYFSLIKTDGRYVYTTKAPNIKRLVFSGGGAKGATYPGAYRALYDYHIMEPIDAIAGSSAGAITAALIATGITPDKFKQLSKETNFKSLLGKKTGWLSLLKRDGKPLYEFLKATIYSNIQDFFANKNITSIAELVANPEWAKKLTTDDYQELVKFFDETQREQPVTFRTLDILNKLDETIFKKLIITAVNKRTGVLKIFDSSTPDVEIASAGRASASIPVLLKSQAIEGVKYIDGGFADNLPTNFFLEATGEDAVFSRLKTLVFAFGEGDHHHNSVHQALYSNKADVYNPSLSEKIKRNLIPEKLVSSRYNYYNTVKKAIGYKNLKKFAQRTVELYVADVKTTDFNKAQRRSEEMFKRGYDDTAAFLESHLDEIIYLFATDKYALLLQIPTAELTTLSPYEDITTADIKMVYEFKKAIEEESIEKVQPFLNTSKLFEDYYALKLHEPLESIKNEAEEVLLHARHRLHAPTDHNKKQLDIALEAIHVADREEEIANALLNYSTKHRKRFGIFGSQTIPKMTLEKAKEIKTAWTLSLE